MALYELRAAEELRSAEMAVLTKLESKYRKPAQLASAADDDIIDERQEPLPISVAIVPVQGTLF